MQKQSELKTKLVNNEITKKDFLSALMKLDQATIEHEECFDNVTIFEDSEVRSIFLNSTELDHYDYFLYLRNFYFHSFQNIAVEESHENIDTAISYLEKAEEIGDKLIKLDPDDYDLFTPYVAATLCYMKEDIDGLHKYLDVLENADKEDGLYFNVIKIRKLYKGLAKYKKANYSRDY